ncbi:MAG: DMT family transporter [Acidobacteriota bacterium]|nr:DMT family transporter [Acidobacteriota bacterium]
MQNPLKNHDKAPAPLSERLPAYIALTTVAWIAAGTFLVAKKTTQVFAPLDLGWFRIQLSFVLIFAIYYLFPRKKERTPLKRGDIHRLAWLGLTGVTANQLLFLTGVKYTSPINAALLYAFTPILVLVAARFLLGESLTWLKFIGIAAAIFGVVLVLAGRGLDLNADYLFGDFLLLLAVVAWAAYTLIGKDLMGRMDAMRANVWAFGAGALSLIPMTPWVLGDFDWSQPGWGGWLGLFYLSGMTSVIAFTLWTWALTRLEAGQTAVFANLQPAFTAVLAWLILDELPTTPVVIGGVLVIAGVVLAQHRQR